MLDFGMLFIFGMVLIVFPFSLVQIEMSLNHHYDVEAFTIWTLIAGTTATIPFMVVSGL